VPFDVLVDRNTASSAEILTAALKEDGGATVVGTRTYGKGVFQEEHDLANGGALKLTVGEFFTPDGENLARTGGIHPEVKAVDKPRTTVDEARQKALETVASQVSG
jgi:carboxyl-terminal processing protease